MKMEKKSNKMTASARDNALDIVPLKEVSKNNTEKPSVTNTKIGICFRITSGSILKGLMRMATPKMTRILVMLLPMTLPNSRSVFPDKWELKEIAISGADVPKATMVKPIMVVDILKFRAKEADPSTKKSAHLIRIMKPRMANPIFNNTSINTLTYCI